MTLVLDPADGAGELRVVALDGVSLIAVIALTLIVIRPPLRRATRVRPGTALRYQ